MRKILHYVTRVCLGALAVVVIQGIANSWTRKGSS